MAKRRKQKFMQLSRQKGRSLTCWPAMDNTKPVAMRPLLHPIPDALYPIPNPRHRPCLSHGHCIQIVQIVCECELSTVFNFGSPHYLGALLMCSLTCHMQQSRREHSTAQHSTDLAETAMHFDQGRSNALLHASNITSTCK